MNIHSAWYYMKFKPTRISWANIQPFELFNEATKLTSSVLYIRFYCGLEVHSHLRHLLAPDYYPDISVCLLIRQ